MLTWSPVSPDGRFVLAYLYLPDDSVVHPHAVVDWETGKTGVWRRIPFGSVVAWNPRGDLVVRRELIDYDKPEGNPLVCRRIPDLTEVWRVAPSRISSAWTPDGEQLITTVGLRTAKTWDLVAVSRTGARRIIAKNCTWTPRRVVTYDGEPAIVCSSGEDKPAPLTLLRMDGAVITQVGPALPRGSYIISPQLDRLAWHGYNDEFAWRGMIDHEGEYSLALRKGSTWETIPLHVPPTSWGYASTLLAAGEEHVMLIQSYPNWTLWAVEWSGKLRKLRWPGPQDIHPYPWVDGYHLITALDQHLELIDGDTGRIERTVPVTFPDWVAKYRRKKVEPRPALLAHAHLRGANLSGRKLQRADLRGVDLRAAKLSGADLSEAKLQQANLAGADFTGARLEEANLTRARLTRAILVKAKLGANLTRSDLSHARLAGADLVGADLTRANLQGADLKGADLTLARLDRTNLRGAKLTTDLTHAFIDHTTRLDAKWRFVRELQIHGAEGRDLRRADLTGAYLENTRLRSANLAGKDLDLAVLDRADLRGANLQRASLTFLRNAILDGADLRGARLHVAQMQGAHLERAQLQRAQLEDARLAGARLQGAQLQDTDLRGVKFREPPGGEKLPAAILQGANVTGAYYNDETLWPPGYDPRQHGAIGLVPGADLHGRDLRPLDLSSANLALANLQNANLQSADLTGARLRRADLTRAQLGRAALAVADLRGADLEGANLQAADLRDARLDDAKLAGAKLTDARYDRHTRWPAGFDPQQHGAIGLLPGADLSGRDLHGVEISFDPALFAVFGHMDLAGVVLKGANLRGSYLLGTGLQGADLEGANLRETTLTDADLREADLQGADLRAAKLDGAKLEGAKLTGARYDAHTRWPKGFDPQRHGATLLK